jgi:hypothetical protein
VPLALQSRLRTAHCSACHDMPIAQAKTAAKEVYSKAKALDEKYSIKEKVPPRAPRRSAACTRLPQSLSRTLLGRDAAPRAQAIELGMNAGWMAWTGLDWPQ